MFGAATGGQLATDLEHRSSCWAKLGGMGSSVVDELGAKV